MAAYLQSATKKLLLDADLDLLVDGIQVALVDEAGFTYAGDGGAGWTSLADITGAGMGIVARSTNNGVSPVSLETKTTTAGTFDADNHTIDGVAGNTVEAVAIFKAGANDAARTLITYHDGLNFTPNGSDVEVQFDGAGIFSI